MNSNLKIARKYIAAGLSVIPTSPQDKKPKISWKIYQAEIPTFAVFDEWCRRYDDAAPAVVCGGVSGFLEILDFDNHSGDAEQNLLSFRELVDNTLSGLMDRLTIESTQSGGYHILYLCPDGVEHNQKLAMRWLDDKTQDAFIETRGEGGYALVAPSPGYKLIQGKISALPVITGEEREILVSAARSFNEVDHSQAQAPVIDETKPGEDFNLRGDCLSTLESEGWKVSGSGDRKLLTRPNKDRGVSATWNYVKGRLYVFSSNAYPFEPNKTYSPFAVEALLKYGGDYKECAKGLAARGYGSNGNGHSKKNGTATMTLTVVNKRGEMVEQTSEEDQELLTEVGNASRFINMWQDMVRFNHTAGLWHIWNGHKWEPDLVKKILGYAKKTIRAMYAQLQSMEKGDAHKNLQRFIFASESRNKLEAMLYLSTDVLGVLHSDFDKNLYCLNLLNGVYDLAKQEFIPGNNPSDLMSKSCPVEYDPDAHCYAWEAFLETIFNNDTELIKFVQKALGLSLCGEQLEEKLFFCYGAGKNGKSVFFNVVRMIFGDYFQKAPTEMLLQKHNESIPNDIARLPGARIVVAEELPENRTLNENKIKNLTGGDTISARFLHKEFFDFKPTHALWMYGNHKPNIKGSDEGIWRRICMIPFLVTIPDEMRRPQNELMAEFEAEKAGIFNWLIEGWAMYIKEGLKQPDIVVEYTKEYRDDQNQVLAFVNECCETKVNLKISKADLLAAYMGWCKKNNEYPQRRNTFYKNVESVSGVTSDVGTGNVKQFVNIGLRSLFNINYPTDYETKF